MQKRLKFFSYTLVLLMCLFQVCYGKEKCRDYFDAKGFYHTVQLCENSSRCCGDCFNRYCCSSVMEKLDETYCKNLFSYNLLINSMVLFIGIIVFKMLFIALICICHLKAKNARRLRPMNQESQVMPYNDALKNSEKVDHESPPPYPGISVIPV